MNLPDPLLHGGLPAPLQPTEKPLSEILNPIDADITQSSQLDMIGVENITEAISAGHTIFSICQHLGVTIRAYLHWVNGLPPEDKQVIENAKLTFYENLERNCQAKMISIAKMDEEIDEEDHSMVSRLSIRDKALQAVERILKSTQTTISRLQARQVLQDYREAETHITQMIVSNEWLAALPDE